jgi:regulator of protease activity HflC (stomatin/prohibitin superfamily)
MARKPEFVGGAEGGALRGLGGRHTGKLAGVAIALALIAVVIVVAYNLCFEYVRPNEFGIKVVKIGVNKGVQETVYEPGLAFRIPFGIQEVYTLPRNTQVLELTNREGVEREGIYVDREAKIQTSDGFFVDVDATILYRIDDPYMVFKKLGPDDNYMQLGLLPKAEAVLKEALGQLTTEEFYDSHLRVEKADLAETILNQKLKEEGLVVEHVLVRYFRYSDAIQDNIEAKKLQDQLVFTNESKGRAAEQNQVLQRAMAEGEYLVKVKEAEGDAYRVEKEAERDLYVRKKEAEADLLVATAEAQGVELKNQAMQALGADAMVAIKMADILKGLDVILLPAGGETGMNPLDLNAVLKTFGVTESGGAASPAPAVAIPTPATTEPVQ